MSRVIRGVLLGSVLAAFVAGSAASLPYASEEEHSGIVPAVSQSAAAIHAGISAMPADKKQPLPPGPTAYFGRLAFKPLAVQIPPGFLTLLAGVCLVAPFGLTTWATLRRRL
jgi:hypothetical protein